MSRRPGTEAEDQAARYLTQHGYTLVTRRFKAQKGEIDLVALDGDTLVFVEVKERLTGFSPEEAVGSRKVSRLISASQEYINKMEEYSRAVRFDVIAIDRDGLRHHIGSIEP